MRRRFTGATLLCLCLPAAAQTVAPNQVVPKTPPVFGSMAPQPATVPEAAAPSTDRRFRGSELEVTLDGVAVNGAFDEMKEALDILWSRVKDRRMTLGELQQAIDDYQQAYETAGFMLARVVTPPQALVQRGLLKLTVIDGFVESIETAGVPERLRAPVADRLAPIVGMRHLQAATIERQLLLLGNLPGVRLRSALATGSQRGGVRLIVDGGYDSVNGSIQMDNRLPAGLGTWEGSVSVAANQAFGAGEKLYASGMGALRSEGQGLPVRTLVAGASVPLGVDGWAVNAEITQSLSRQRAETNLPSTRGTFQRIAARASYPWEMDRNRRIDFRASLERVRQSIVATDFNLTLNQDEYRVLRLGTDIGGLGSPGSYQVAAFLSSGLGGRGDAQAKASGVPLSRAGATPGFRKLDFTLQWSTELSDAAELVVFGHGQFAGGKPLMKSEQLSLEGGSDILSFPAGTFAVDSGGAGRAEIARPFWTPLGAIRSGVFAAFGAGTLAQPSAVEDASVRASSVGVSIGSVPSEATAPWIPYFHLDAALRRSSSPQAPRGWTFLALIGVRS